MLFRCIQLDSNWTVRLMVILIYFSVHIRRLYPIIIKGKRMIHIIIIVSNIPTKIMCDWNVFIWLQIAHVIREIRRFQETPYKIDLIPKVSNYLLDSTLLLKEDDLYRKSLEIEPRTSRLSSAALIGLPPSIGQTSLKRDNWVGYESA